MTGRIKRLPVKEHDIQAMVIQWANLEGQFLPELLLLYAVPNAAVGTARAFLPEKFWYNLKRMFYKEGLKPGVPDLFLPVARGGYHGLYIEMKTPTGRLSKEQTWWLDQLTQQGYFCRVCYGFDEALNLIKDYLKL